MAFGGVDGQNPFMGGARATGYGGGFGNSTQMALSRYSDESQTNKIHFFKFD